MSASNSGSCGRDREERGWASDGAPTFGSLTQSEAMTPPIILLFTCDLIFDQMVSEALLTTGAIVLTARNVAQALQLVSHRGRELSLALMDFNGGCRGMTLLSAVHTCFEDLPILVTTEEDAEHATAVAYANGARRCLTKPRHASMLAAAIADLHVTRYQPVAA
jgi:DNA-binding response OmpR family regulator